MAIFSSPRSPPPSPAGSAQEEIPEPDAPCKQSYESSGSTIQDIRTNLLLSIAQKLARKYGKKATPQCFDGLSKTVNSKPLKDAGTFVDLETVVPMLSAFFAPDYQSYEYSRWITMEYLVEAKDEHYENGRSHPDYKLAKKCVRAAASNLPWEGAKRRLDDEDIVTIAIYVSSRLSLYLEDFQAKQEAKGLAIAHSPFDKSSVLLEMCCVTAVQYVGERDGVSGSEQLKVLTQVKSAVEADLERSTLGRVAGRFLGLASYLVPGIMKKQPHMQAPSVSICALVSYAIQCTMCRRIGRLACLMVSLLMTCANILLAYSRLNGVDLYVSSGFLGAAAVIFMLVVVFKPLRDADFADELPYKKDEERSDTLSDLIERLLNASDDSRTMRLACTFAGLQLVFPMFISAFDTDRILGWRIVAVVAASSYAIGALYWVLSSSRRGWKHRQFEIV